MHLALDLFAIVDETTPEAGLLVGIALGNGLGGLGFLGTLVLGTREHGRLLLRLRLLACLRKITRRLSLLLLGACVALALLVFLRSHLDPFV